MFSVLKGFLSFETPANKVLELKQEAYIPREVLYREDGLVLYTPPANKANSPAHYEVVLHRPYTENSNVFR